MITNESIGGVTSWLLSLHTGDDERLPSQVKAELARVHSEEDRQKLLHDIDSVLNRLRSHSSDKTFKPIFQIALVSGLLGLITRMNFMSMNPDAGKDTIKALENLKVIVRKYKIPKVRNENMFNENLDELEVTSEAVKFRRKKLTILQQRATVFAFALARQAKDPLYPKCMLHRGKWKHFKALILKKYGHAGMAAARRTRTKGGI